MALPVFGSTMQWSVQTNALSPPLPSRGCCQDALNPGPHLPRGRVVLRRATGRRSEGTWRVGSGGIFWRGFLSVRRPHFFSARGPQPPRNHGFVHVVAGAMLQKEIRALLQRHRSIRIRLSRRPHTPTRRLHLVLAALSRLLTLLIGADCHCWHHTSVSVYRNKRQNLVGFIGALGFRKVLQGLLGFGALGPTILRGVSSMGCSRQSLWYHPTHSPVGPNSYKPIFCVYNYGWFLLFGLFLSVVYSAHLFPLLAAVFFSRLFFSR